MNPEAAALIWIRLDNGLTLTALADWLDVHQKSVSRWERGARPIPAELQNRIDQIPQITETAIETLAEAKYTVLTLGDVEDFHAFWDTWPEYAPLPPSWWWIVTHRAVARGYITIDYHGDGRYTR